MPPWTSDQGYGQTKVWTSSQDRAERLGDGDPPARGPPCPGAGGSSPLEVGGLRLPIPPVCSFKDTGSWKVPGLSTASSNPPGAWPLFFPKGVDLSLVLTQSPSAVRTRAQLPQVGHEEGPGFWAGSPWVTWPVCSS